MIKTDTESVNEVIERLSRSALTGDDASCTVTKNDLSTVLLAYQLELTGNADKSNCSETNTSARLFREAVLQGAKAILSDSHDFKGSAKEISGKRKIEQRIVGMEMVVEHFGHDHGLNRAFEVTPDQIYDLCDEIYGGDSQHVRGKFQASEGIAIQPED